MDFDSIWRPGRLIFTFGTCWSREGAYSEQGAYFSFEKQPNAQKKTLMFFENGTITEAVTVTNMYTWSYETGLANIL